MKSARHSWIENDPLKSLKRGILGETVADRRAVFHGNDANKGRFRRRRKHSTACDECSNERIENIHNAYRLIYTSNLNVSDALERIKADLEMNDDIKYIVNFIESSARGIIR